MAVFGISKLNVAVRTPNSPSPLPKFAAEATLEHEGRTYYFIDEQTKSEFVQKQALVTVWGRRCGRRRQEAE